MSPQSILKLILAALECSGLCNSLKITQDPHRKLIIGQKVMFISHRTWEWGALVIQSILEFTTPNWAHCKQCLSWSMQLHLCCLLVYLLYTSVDAHFYFLYPSFQINMGIMSENLLSIHWSKTLNYVNILYRQHREKAQ